MQHCATWLPRNYGPCMNIALILGSPFSLIFFSKFLSDLQLKSNGRTIFLLSTANFVLHLLRFYAWLCVIAKKLWNFSRHSLLCSSRIPFWFPFNHYCCWFPSSIVLGQLQPPHEQFFCRPKPAKRSATLLRFMVRISENSLRDLCSSRLISEFPPFVFEGGLWQNRSRLNNLKLDMRPTQE